MIQPTETGRAQAPIHTYSKKRYDLWKTYDTDALYCVEIPASVSQKKKKKKGSRGKIVAYR